MKLLDIMLKRRSVRKYNGQAVSDEALNRILTAGLLAPSSRNKLPVEFITVSDTELLQQLSLAKTSGSALISGCSRAVVVIGDTEKSDVWVEDCSIAMTYMQLMATELGVGNCWVQIRKRLADDTVLSEDFVRANLKIPKNYSVLAILALGMCNEFPTPHTEDYADFGKVHSEKF